jgi:RNA recognition motif-containing protein
MFEEKFCKQINREFPDIGVFMAANIYVGNISWNASEDELRDLFTQYGEVSSARIISDKMTGRSRGFGFVEMVDSEAAQSAISALNESDWLGRTIRVNEAENRERRPNNRY